VLAPATVPRTALQTPASVASRVHTTVPFGAEVPEPKAPSLPDHHDGGGFVGGPGF
jgi:hypothetical protein